MVSQEPLFQTIDATQINGGGLLKLLCRTAHEKGRVEITNCDGGTCVLVSKDELDSLERALEILSETDDGQQMRVSIVQFALALRGDTSSPALASKA